MHVVRKVGDTIDPRAPAAITGKPDTFGKRARADTPPLKTRPSSRHVDRVERAENAELEFSEMAEKVRAMGRRKLSFALLAATWEIGVKDAVELIYNVESQQTLVTTTERTGLLMRV
jgi:hypothetical protein